MTVASPGDGIIVHVEHLDRGTPGVSPRRKFGHQLLAQPAALAGIDLQAAHCDGRPGAMAGAKAAFADLPGETPEAMNSTVCGGTSPTAVT